MAAACLMFGLFGAMALPAQVIDESTPQDTFYTGVGVTGHDYVAQSFFANITQVDSIGVWLRQADPNSEVRLLLTADNGATRPDLNAILYTSNLITPSISGSWYYETGFTSLLEPGRRYWLVVDGYNEPGTSGQAAVGISNTYTDTNSPLFYSDNGGQSWAGLAGRPMSVLVAGDTCRFSVTVSPPQPVICPGQSVNLSAPSGYLTYSWSTGATSSTITVSQTGFYSVSVVRSDYCVGTGARTVVPGAVPVTSLDSSYEFCQGDTLVLTAIPFYNAYLWSNGTTINTTQITTSGLYWVEITSGAGCKVRDSTNVTVYPLPFAALGPDTSLCEGQYVFFDGGPGYASYDWSNGQSGRSVFVDQSDSIWVVLADSNGCEGRSDTVVVTVNPNPGKPNILHNFQGLTTGVYFAYQWLLNGQAISGAVGRNYPDPEPGDYQVLVTNAFGCTAISDTITVTAEPVGDFISEGFSPNGDGLNEVFFVEGISRYPNAVLVVYNRYGDEVYRSEPYQNEWSGTNKTGSPLPDGNYFYILDLQTGNPPIKGVVLINR